MYRSDDRCSNIIVVQWGGRAAGSQRHGALAVSEARQTAAARPSGCRLMLASGEQQQIRDQTVFVLAACST